MPLPSRLCRTGRLTASALALTLLAGCATTMVAQQRIPVSTSPSGATVYANGAAACTTPCEVSLDRNRDHLLVLSKDGYQQQDFSIHREYQSADVLLGVLNAGLSTGRLTNNLGLGLNSALASKQRQENLGTAYRLEPSVVSVRLVPLAGFTAHATAPQAQRAIQAEPSPLQALAADDQHMLENGLESAATGELYTWRNPRSGVSFALVPEPAELAGMNVVRVFTLTSHGSGVEPRSGHFRAHRVAQGEWRVDPAPVPYAGAAPTSSAVAPIQRTLDALRP